MLSLVTLGRLSLTKEGRAVLPRRRKELALLAILARRAPRPVSRTELATLLWGERDEARARQSLRQALSELRQAVGDALEVSPESVRLDPERVEFDVARFEAAIRGRDPALALSFWHGDFLTGAEDLEHEGFGTWLEQERTSLRKQAAWAFEQVADTAQARGDWAGAVQATERWCAMLPYDESAQRRLADALRLAGGLPGVTPPRLGARGLLTPDLIGRGEALGRLSAAWTVARQGGSAVALVVGDEGLGKSRLIREFARMVGAQPGRSLVLEGQAFDAERARAWSTLRPMLAALAEAPGLLAAPPAALAVVAGIAPEIQERLPQLPAGSDAIDAQEAVLRVVSDVAAEMPVLLVVDDAPAADRASLAVLRGLVRRPPPGMLVVLTARPPASELGPAAAHLIRVELTPLDAREVALMVASMAPLTPETGGPLAERLQRDSSGHPGQVERLVAAWAEAGVLAPGPDGRWGLSEELGDRPLPVAAGMRENTIGQLERLPAAARAVAEAAAVFEEAVEPEVLERTSGAGSSRFAPAIGELLSRRILRESRRPVGSYEFASEAVRRAAYDSLAPSRRRRLHRAAAAAIRRLPATAPNRAARRQQHERLGHTAEVRRRRILSGAAAASLILAGVWAVARSGAAQVGAGAQVLLADVDNATTDSTLGRAFYAAATIGLSGSRHVALFPRSRVRETLARMRRSGADSALTEPLAREIAAREGLAMVVALGVIQVDSSYLLTARLIDPQTGRDLRTASERVSGRAGLLEGLDRLLRSSRRALGESRTQLRAGAEPLPQVTTSSLEALRSYVAGGEAWTRRDVAGAQQHWERAAALDSNFALANAALADVWYIGYNDRARGDRWMNRALGQLDRLTEREQLRIRAQAAQRQGRNVEAADFARMLAERYPTRDTWYNLGTVLLGQYRCRGAIPAIRKALAFDSLFTNAHINLATCLQLAGPVEASLVAYAAAARSDSMALFRGNINHEWGVAFVRAGRPAEADSAYRRMTEVGEPFDRARGHRSLAWLSMYRGRFREAVLHLEQAIGLLGDSPGLPVFRNRVILAEAYLMLGDVARARRQLDSAAALGKSLDIVPAFSLYFGHAELRAGRLEAAAKALKQTISAGAPAGDNDRNSIQALDGALRLARGDAPGAIDLVRSENGPLMAAFRLAVLAEAYGARGNPDSALTAAVRLSETFAFGEESQLEWLRGPLLVARYAEALGDSPTARAAYSRFIEQWKQGDQNLPDLVAARRALARLQAKVPR